MEATETKVAAEAAHAVIRKYFASLHKVVVNGNIPIQLYSNGLIDQSTISLSDREKGTRILLNLQEKISQSMDGNLLRNFCEILQKEDSTMANLTEAIGGKPGRCM